MRIHLTTTNSRLDINIGTPLSPSATRFSLSSFARDVWQISSKTHGAVKLQGYLKSGGRYKGTKLNSLLI